MRWKVPAGKISVIPNGLEVDEFAYDPQARRQVRDQFDIPTDAYVIGALGRLDSNKRVGLTMEAAAPLLGERCRMLVIGRGEELPRLEAAAKSLGVADWVIFGGYQADSRAMLSAFDLYVAASEQETFGLAVLEALASGLPVLYTTCPALDGISTERARRVEGTVAALRHEIRSEMEVGPRPRQVPPGSSICTACSPWSAGSMTSTSRSSTAGPGELNGRCPADRPAGRALSRCHRRLRSRGRGDRWDRGGRGVSAPQVAGDTARGKVDLH